MTYRREVASPPPVIWKGMCDRAKPAARRVRAKPWVIMASGRHLITGATISPEQCPYSWAEVLCRCGSAQRIRAGVKTWTTAPTDDQMNNEQ